MIPLSGILYSSNLLFIILHLLSASKIQNKNLPDSVIVQPFYKLTKGFTENIFMEKKIVNLFYATKKPIDDRLTAFVLLLQNIDIFNCGRFTETSYNYIFDLVN